MKKIISIFAVIIVISGAMFFNRVRIRVLFDEWRAPELLEAVWYSDIIASEAPAERSNPKSATDAVLRESDVQRDDKIASVVREFTPSMPEGLPRNDTKEASSPSIPLEYNLAVPFQPQAPNADWGMPYQEACEEASLIMADGFFNSRSLSKDGMDESIKKLVDWEIKTFGYYEDTTAQEVALMAQGYFGLSAMLDYDVSVDTIKKHLSRNKLVLVPAAGRELANPYFSGDGPLYHMLVIRGWTSDGHFITNDPGTKRGEAFLYKYDDLINAVRDWPREHGGYKDNVTEDEMSRGDPVMIVVDRNQ